MLARNRPWKKKKSSLQLFKKGFNLRDQTRKNQNKKVENEQQRLEIELRRKALESLRAKKKKAVSH